MPRRARPLLALALAGSIAMTAVTLPSTAANAETSAPASPPAAASTFSDIRGDEWYATAANALADRAAMLGGNGGSFDPDGAVTRGEMAYLLARAMGLSESSSRPFSDVGSSDWFAGSVGVLFDSRIVQGTSATTFSPGRTVTRQEATSLVMKGVTFAHEDDPSIETALSLIDQQAQDWLGCFRDRPLLDHPGAVSVAAAYRLGILDSPTDGWFFPAGNLTRAELVVMLYRAFLRPLVPRTAYPLVLPAVPEYERLSVGSGGSLVSFLQTRLTALHYPCGPVDGRYDSRTRDAVMAFQKVERLERTGRVTSEVWERLATAEVPAPRLPGAGDRCEVDLSRQVLFMVSGNEVTKIVHVSTGKLGTRTGHFSINDKYEGWVRCVTLEGKMYYPSYVVSKTAIHGYDDVPPYPASHGCVRIPVWTAEELYYELPSGMVVDIFH